MGAERPCRCYWDIFPSLGWDFRPRGSGRRWPPRVLAVARSAKLLHFCGGGRDFASEIRLMGADVRRKAEDRGWVGDHRRNLAHCMFRRNKTRRNLCALFA